MSTIKLKSSTLEKSCSGNFPAIEFVYSLQNQEWYFGDVVDAMLWIMDDDGPQPMWNARPVKKKRNGSDKFYQDHQEEYEAREKQSRSHVCQVNHHNNACPKMYDELERRRSTANAKAIHSKQVTCVKVQECPKWTCSKLKRLNRKRSNIKHMSHNKIRKPTHKDNRSQIRKPRRRYQRKIIKTSPRTHGISITNTSCQYSNSLYSLKKINKMTSAIFSNLEPLSYKMEDEKKASITPKRSYISLEQKGQETTGLELDSSRSSQHRDNVPSSQTHFSSRNPDTSQPSLSSYNSFMSMDHEPMGQQ